MAALGRWQVEGDDDGVQRPWMGGSVGQFHLDQVAEALEGFLGVAAGGAEPAEFQAADGVHVAVADEGGLVVSTRRGWSAGATIRRSLGQAAGCCGLCGVASQRWFDVVSNIRSGQVKLAAARLRARRLATGR